MDCSLPGSSVHGIFQARVLEWGAIAFSDIKHYRKEKLKIKMMRLYVKHLRIKLHAVKIREPAQEYFGRHGQGELPKRAIFSRNIVSKTVKLLLIF